jgi:flagella basal body P-ring formation protein FlgA
MKLSSPLEQYQTLKRKFAIGALFILISAWSSGAPASDRKDTCLEPQMLNQCAQAKLEARWPESRIVLGSEIQWDEPSRLAELFSRGSIPELKVLSDHESGLARLQIAGVGGRVVFKALRNVYVPQKRVFPNQGINPENLKMIEVDLARSPYREHRQLFLYEGQSTENLEAKQSLLEDQPIQLSSVQVRPDLRRGDQLQVEVRLGDITLTTRAQALENGLKGNRVRVLLEKQRREMVGVLRQDGTVEVLL